MLTYVAALVLSILVYGPVEGPGRLRLPAVAHVHRFRHRADPARRHPPASRRPDRARSSRVAAWVLMTRTIIGFEIQVVGQAPAAAPLCRLRPQADRSGCACCSAAGSPGSPACSRSPGPIGQLSPTTRPGYGFTAIIVAFLGRLHPLGIVPRRSARGAVLPRRRERADRGRPAAGGHRPVPGHAAVLPARVATSWSATASASLRRAGRSRQHEPRWSPSRSS